jgi:hypothetical protein
MKEKIGYILGDFFTNSSGHPGVRVLFSCLFKFCAEPNVYFHNTTAQELPEQFQGRFYVLCDIIKWCTNHRALKLMERMFRIFLVQGTNVGSELKGQYTAKVKQIKMRYEKDEWPVLHLRQFFNSPPPTPAHTHAHSHRFLSFIQSGNRRFLQR